MGPTPAHADKATEIFASSKNRYKQVFPILKKVNYVGQNIYHKKSGVITDMDVNVINKEGVSTDQTISRESTNIINFNTS
jgi:hypothetical protein